MPQAIPTLLDPTRSCYYQLPSTLSEWELSGYERIFRQQYKSEFEFRRGNIFYFQLPSKAARNAFLNTMEIGAIASGLQVQRVWETKPLLL